MPTGSAQKELNGWPDHRPVRRRLGGALVDAGAVSVADMETALCEQRHHPGVLIGQLLLRMELIERSDLLRALDELSATSAVRARRARGESAAGEPAR